MNSARDTALPPLAAQCATVTEPHGAQSVAAEATVPPGWLTVSEAAEQIGHSRDTIHGWITKGRLPAVHRDGRRWVRPVDLHAVRAAVHLGDVIPAWRQHPHRAGQRLRLLRQAAGCTQKALAGMSGIEHEMISRLETGQQVPRATVVQRLASALAIDPTVLVDDTALTSPGMTTDQVADRLEVPRQRVQRWLCLGKLPGTKVSGQWRVPLDAVLEIERRERLRGRSRRLDPRYQG